MLLTSVAWQGGRWTGRFSSRGAGCRGRGRKTRPQDGSEGNAGIAWDTAGVDWDTQKVISGN